MEVTFTTSSPVPELYEVTVPSILLDESYATITFWLTMYDSPVPTVKVFDPVPIATLVMLVVEYLSPAAPVGPVAPVDPVGPVGP